MAASAKKPRRLYLGDVTAGASGAMMVVAPYSWKVFRASISDSFEPQTELRGDIDHPPNWA
jgi:hypothetical protein